MALDKDIVKKGLIIAKDSTIYGELMESLTREELLAVAALGWKAYKDSLNSGRAFNHD